MEWHSGWAVTSPEFYELAANTTLVDKVRELIGQDVLLWGAHVVTRAPGQVHPWHTDIESSSPTGHTVSVWIGLANTTAASSLKVVPFSHQFGVTLQQVIQEEGKSRESLQDEDVTRCARSRDARSSVLTVDSRDGQAIFFDGRLWHGSHNLNAKETRYALLLQYATPETPIRMHNPQRLTWPFEIYDTPRPPCILVSGNATDATNRIVPGPASGYDPNLPVLSTRVHSLHLPLEQVPKTGWNPHYLFRGATPDLKILSCHVSVFDPGRQPHPPHRHGEEEILMVLEGEADLVLEDAVDRDKVNRHHVSPGVFAYYPAGFAHTIHNTSNAAVTYLMFKWQTDCGQDKSLLKHQLVTYADALAGMTDAGANGFVTKPLLNGPTTCLRHLHSHATRLEPGAGYDSHIDACDIGIIVLKGTVETLGQRVGALGVVFYAGGQPHGIRNVGEVPAEYLVFEFHGRHCDIPLIAERRLSHRVMTVLRDPKRLSAGVARRARALVRRGR